MDLTSCSRPDSGVSSTNMLNSDFKYSDSGSAMYDPAEVERAYPEFPDDLSIGRHIITVPVIGHMNGEVTGISMYANGVHIMRKGNQLDIHKSQIISLNELTKNEIYKQEISELENNVTNDILIDIVSTSKIKTETEYFFIVNYWDVETKNPNAVILETQKSNKQFINEFYTDVHKY